jgi:hypothetical protein
MNDETPWEGRALNAAAAFAAEYADLGRTNAYDIAPLTNVINTLMTELWDKGFSQTEIREAFDEATADLPRYAAGQERRS